jgi:DNA-binding YbaB/EbfC family protein
MKGALGDLLQQAQKMQSEMQRVQQEITALEATGESGGGMVQVRMNGRHDVLRVSIAPELMSEERSMLEDLVAAAVNDANRRIERESKDKLAQVTGGIELPPGFKLPF